MREPNPELTPLLQKLFTPGINVSKKKTLQENPSSVCKKYGLSFLLQNDMFLIQVLYGFKSKTLCEKTLLFGVKRIHTFSFLKQKSLVAKSKQDPGQRWRNSG